MTSELPRSLGRALLGLGLAAACAALAVGILADGARPFLLPGPGEWIEYPHVRRTVAHPERPLETVFSRELTTPASGSEEIELRCLGECEYEPLRAGATSLRVVVRRSNGPPAMALEMRDRGTVVVESDAAWTAAQSGAPPRPARLAAERANPEAREPLPPVDWGRLALLALAAVAAALAWNHFDRSRARGATVAAGIAAVWGALWWKSGGIEPGFIGFDAEHHVHYVRYVVESGRLPMPRDGVQTYQPPFFYLLSTLWLKVFGASIASEGAPQLLRALTFGLGLANLAGVAALVRRFLPERDEAAQLAVLLAAAVPVHLLMAHAFANEIALAAVSTWTLVALFATMQKTEPSLRDGLVVGALLGVALMSKLSALVLVPVAIGGLVVAHPKRSNVWAAALVAAALVAGGYYLRIAQVHGTPFVGNWDATVGFAWWQDPGLRSAVDYARFGSVFGHPYYAGFESVWDGLYSTLFADGLASGAWRRSLGPAWNDDLVRGVLVLAVVPMFTLGVGIFAGVRRLFGRPTWRGLVLAALLVAMTAAFLLMTLRVPSYAQAKASYWSPAFGAVAVMFALGVDALLTWLRARSRGTGATVFVAALFAWAFASVAMLWIDDDAPTTLRSRADRALAVGATERALVYLGRAERLKDAPVGTGVWIDVGRCRIARKQGRVADATAACARALANNPEDADALFHNAQLARVAGDDERALALFERLRAAAPHESRGLAELALVASELGRTEQAVDAARELLRFDPGSPTALAALRRLGAR